ncbi:MAG: DUF456 domain-containing protein [Anaerolineae bacterium]|nr:DUF456 domain-containing protein [Anaerolineae bacterium]
MAALSWTFWIALVMMIVGLLGVVLPVIPGTGFMWIVVLIYAISERFATIDVVSFIVLTVLGLGGATADLWMSQLGAKVGGASLWSTVYSLVGSLVGGLIGLIFAGIGAIPGMIIGSVAGVLINEHRERQDWKLAWQATIGLMLGFTLSSAVQFAIGLLMLTIFIWQALRG